MAATRPGDLASAVRGGVGGPSTMLAGGVVCLDESSSAMSVAVRKFGVERCILMFSVVVLGRQEFRPEPRRSSIFTISRDITLVDQHQGGQFAPLHHVAMTSDPLYFDRSGFYLRLCHIRTKKCLVCVFFLSG